MFIANLKRFRKKAGLSQMKLAEKCNTAASYIGEIEIGRKFPSVEMIERIAGALDAEPWQLFKEERTVPAVNIEVRELYKKLNAEEREEFTDFIMYVIRTGFEKAVNAPPESTTPP